MALSAGSLDFGCVTVGRSKQREVVHEDQTILEDNSDAHITCNVASVQPLPINPYPHLTFYC
jgi:hypothetical protein